ncbi:MAG: hypothetical protein HS104_06415 [Polyangiaceae bacterium]|nr:hypothetical protein [Polyangiaceae bacterium]MCL4755162.1 hypothetical protein [Myxococcales bacterium]
MSAPTTRLALRAIPWLVAALATATACAGEADGSGANTCPTDFPSGACSADPELRCEYGGSCGYTFACANGQWVKVGLPCDILPSCPPKSTPLPKVGDGCPHSSPAYCSFTASCGWIGSAECHAGIYDSVFDPCHDGGMDAAPDSGAEAGPD